MKIRNSNHRKNNKWPSTKIIKCFKTLWKKPATEESSLQIHIKVAEDQRAELLSTPRAANEIKLLVRKTKSKNKHQIPFGTVPRLCKLQCDQRTSNKPSACQTGNKIF